MESIKIAVAAKTRDTGDGWHVIPKATTGGDFQAHSAEVACMANILHYEETDNQHSQHNRVAT